MMAHQAQMENEITQLRTQFLEAQPRTGWMSSRSAQFLGFASNTITVWPYALPLIAGVFAIVARGMLVRNIWLPAAIYALGTGVVALSAILVKRIPRKSTRIRILLPVWLAYRAMAAGLIICIALTSLHQNNILTGVLLSAAFALFWFTLSPIPNETREILSDLRLALSKEQLDNNSNS